MGMEDCHAGGCSEDEREYYTGDTDYSSPYRIAEEEAQVCLKAGVEKQYDGGHHGKAIELRSHSQGFGIDREKTVRKARECKAAKGKWADYDAADKLAQN